MTGEHFYYIGAKKSNRKPMLEALVINYQPHHKNKPLLNTAIYHQPKLFEEVQFMP